MSRDREACDHRVRAAELSPASYALIVEAATALRKLDRKLEAEAWYKQVTIYVLVGRAVFGKFSRLEMVLGQCLSWTGP